MKTLILLLILTSLSACSSDHISRTTIDPQAVEVVDAQPQPQRKSFGRRFLKMWGQRMVNYQANKVNLTCSRGMPGSHTYNCTNY